MSMRDSHVNAECRSPGTSGKQHSLPTGGLQGLQPAVVDEDPMPASAHFAEETPKDALAQREMVAAERKSVASGNAQRQPSPEASRPISAGGRATIDTPRSLPRTSRRENHQA